jgi:hypothetical protein
MTKFLEYFPKIPYDIEKTKISDYELVTNITFRVGIIREVLNNAGSYYLYTVKDGETPEIVAENAYRDPEAHWIILYANEIYDPQYDWPLSTRAFRNYIVNKYRNQAAQSLSISNTVITDTQVISWTQDTTNEDSVHHYEKQIIRYNATDDVTMSINIEVNKSNLTSVLNSTLENVPYDFYTSANTSDPRALEFSGAFETFNINGKTINETIKGAAITYYDYENELNEAKRFIKIIKSEYYSQIIEEYKTITNTTTERYLRRLT